MSEIDGTGDFFLQDIETTSAVRAGDAGGATASSSKHLGAKLIRFGQIWLHLGKIE